MSIFDRWRDYKETRKLIREWEEALNGPGRYEIFAMGPDEWARMKEQREKEQLQLIEAFSVRMFKLAAEGADAIRKLSDDRTVEQPKYGLDREWFPVFTAFHGFCLHITDREAFALAGNAGRCKIMRGLVFHSIELALSTVLEGMPSDRLPAIKKECVEHLNWSNEAYGQYKKIAPAPGEPAEGTAVWRLGVEVAELAGRPGNKAYILKSQEHALKVVTTLDAKAYVAQFGTKGLQT
jgi:hypothetical protein